MISTNITRAAIVSLVGVVFATGCAASAGPSDESEVDSSDSAEQALASGPQKPALLPNEKCLSSFSACQTYCGPSNLAEFYWSGSSWSQYMCPVGLGLCRCSPKAR